MGLVSRCYLLPFTLHTLALHRSFLDPYSTPYGDVTERRGLERERVRVDGTLLLLLTSSARIPIGITHCSSDLIQDLTSSRLFYPPLWSYLDLFTRNFGIVH